MKGYRSLRQPFPNQNERESNLQEVSTTLEEGNIWLQNFNFFGSIISYNAIQELRYGNRLGPEGRKKEPRVNVCYYFIKAGRELNL